MDTATVEQAFIEAHKDIQEDLGQGAVMSRSTTPLSDLKGFRSVLIPNIIRNVARRLGMAPPGGKEIRNIYVSKDGRQKLSISYIAQNFRDMYCERAK